MSSADMVTDYLMDNYYNDVERMVGIKLVQSLTVMPDLTPEKLADFVDRAALFNGIEKSYCPSAIDIELASREIIRGMGFVMYKRSRDE